jgi:thiosulfate dehydrogenase
LAESGAIPANADATPGPVEKWLARNDLRAVLEHEGPKRANPEPVTDANLIKGIRVYATYCAICHGTDAGHASPVAEGEYPAPPQLPSNGVDPEGWTFWKIKHGIRWTGMPSWKYTFNDTQIWTLALFLKNMNQLPAAPEAVWQGVRQPDAGVP